MESNRPTVSFRIFKALFFFPELKHKHTDKSFKQKIRKVMFIFLAILFIKQETYTQKTTQKKLLGSFRWRNSEILIEDIWYQFVTPLSLF